MPLWKKILLRSAGFGAGLALILCAALVVWLWYSNRPKPPKPWDSRAITAEFDYITPEGDKNDLSFVYTLQNNTESDYRVDSDASIEITGKLKREKEFSEFGGHNVTVGYPIFVPAKSRVRCSLRIEYPYPLKQKDAATHEEQKRNWLEVAQYVVTELPNLDGFVLFDAGSRYKIDFPNGWAQFTEKAASVQK